MGRREGNSCKLQEMSRSDRSYGREDVNYYRRERSGDRPDRDQEDDRDRKKDRDRDDRRSSRRHRSRRSRSRSRSSSRSHRQRSSHRRSRSRTPPVSEMERKTIQMDRDQRTVFVSQLHPRVTMRQIYEFFSKSVVVTDIQVVEDQRTHKSKGIAYVEVAAKEMIPTILSMNGQLIQGYPCAVQMSQAERIRMLSDMSSAVSIANQGPTRLHVSGLDEKLTLEDLKPLFEVFGECSVSLSINPKTNLSEGVAYVSFSNADSAKSAQREMNGMEVLDQRIKVIMADDLAPKRSTNRGGSELVNLGELDDDTGGGLHMTAQSRVALMQRLQRNSLGNSDIMSPSPSTSSTITAPASNIPKMKPTTCVVLKNMFDPNEETNPDFDLEIRDDVAGEASKIGNLLHIFVDRESNGNVFLRYKKESEAHAALNAFNQRWFASRQIAADFVPEATYNLRFPESARY